MKRISDKCESALTSPFTQVSKAAVSGETKDERGGGLSVIAGGHFLFGVKW